MEKKEIERERERVKELNARNCDKGVYISSTEKEIEGKKEHDRNL